MYEDILKIVKRGEQNEVMAAFGARVIQGCRHWSRDERMNYGKNFRNCVPKFFPGLSCDYNGGWFTALKNGEKYLFKTYNSVSQNIILRNKFNFTKPDENGNVDVAYDMGCDYMFVVYRKDRLIYMIDRLMINALAFEKGSKIYLKPNPGICTTIYEF